MRWLAAATLLPAAALAQQAGGGISYVTRRASPALGDLRAAQFFAAGGVPVSPVGFIQGGFPGQGAAGAGVQRLASSPEGAVEAPAGAEMAAANPEPLSPQAVAALSAWSRAGNAEARWVLQQQLRPSPAAGPASE